MQQTPPAYAGPYNLSRFTDCIFETTDDFMSFPSETALEYAHVRLMGVRGISFTACTFQDGRNQPDSEIKGFYGISSHNSQFIAQGRCNPPGQPCETWDPTIFKNLYIAVNAGNFGENRPFTVDRCEFLNNHVGVQSWAVDYLTLTRNKFYVGGATNLTLPPHPPGLSGPRGITIYGGTEYSVQENELTAGTPEGSLLGIVAIETGEDFNLINNNDFVDLSSANLSLGLNRSTSDPFLGLEYQCNNNQDNTFDFLVPDPSSDYLEAGIRPSQGSAQTSAGNKFTPVLPSVGLHFFNTVKAPITYYYKVGEPDDEPVSTNSGIVKLPSSNSNNCVSKLVEEPITPKKTRFNERTAQVDSLESEIKLKIDDGDTESLIQEITFSTGIDSQAVKGQLLQISPYVSQAALLKYLQRNDLFSEAQITEVLALNPEVLRIPSYWASVEETLSPGAVSQLDTARQIRTQRNDEEAAIAAVAAERAYLARQITQYYMGDTTSLQSDSIRYWIGQVVTLPHQYVLVGQYLQEGDTIQTLTAMNSIPSNFSLSQAQQEAYGNFEDLVQLKKGQLEEGDWMVFALENEVELAGLADQGISRGAIQAQHYYNFVFGEMYYPIIEWIGGGNQSAGKVQAPPTDQNSPELDKATPEIKLEVIPNPARESVQFQYSIPEADNQAWLRLFDPSGRMVQSWKLEVSSGAIQWQIDRLAAKGVYMVSLLIEGQPPVSRRFSVVE